MILLFVPCLGLNDDPIHCRTYLGHVLNIGDSVLGLDLKNSNVNNPELEKLPVDKVRVNGWIPK